MLSCKLSLREFDRMDMDVHVLLDSAEFLT